MVSILLLAALVLAPVVGGGFGEWANGIIQIIVFSAVCAFSLLKGRASGTWLRAPGIAALAVFFLAVAVSAIFSECVYLSLVRVLFVMACLSVYMLSFALARDSKAAVMLVVGLAVSALGVCVFGIRDYAIGAGGGSRFWAAVMSAGEHVRLSGTFNNPNFLAGFLAMMLPISLGLYLVARKSSVKLLFGMAFAIQTMALMLTGSKFGIIAAAAAMLVFLVLALANRSLSKPRLVRLLIILAIIAPIAFVFSGSVRSRVEEAKVGGIQSHSSLFRVYTWKATAQMIRRNPLVGVGAGAFSAAYPRYAIAGYTAHAHQGYLQTGAESGLLAMIAMILGIVAIGWAGSRGIFKLVAPEELQAESGDIFTWQDIIPADGWRLINCALVGALAASVSRNLVDSDWYIMGISLPFWAMAGVLVSRTGAASQPLKMTPRAAVLSACVIGIALSVSFGLGDLFVPDDMVIQTNDSLSDVAHKYEMAAIVSPWNPVFHRELGKYLVADGQVQRGMDHLNMAIRLAPKDGSGYFWRGFVEKQNGDLAAAAKSFNQSLKFSPNSTQTLSELAETYKDLARISAFESTLRRMLAIENTPYEKIKGVPEMVDTRYAIAHIYFGEKYLAQRRYKDAVPEFEAAIKRLEYWRSYLHTTYGKVARLTGKISEKQENELLDILRRSYDSLSEAQRKLCKKE